MSKNKNFFKSPGDYFESTDNSRDNPLILDGSWYKKGVKINATSSQLNSLSQSNKAILQGRLDDVSTASALSLSTILTGTVTGVWARMQGAITGTDAVVTFSINGVDLPQALLIPVLGSGLGTGQYVAITSAGREITPTDEIRATSDGASTGACALEIAFVIDLD